MEQMINTNPSMMERLMDEVDLDLSEQFTFDGFQVVRGEFFAHRREPCITFANYRLYANAACVNKVEEYDYVQFLVNAQTKMVAIKPCSEDEKDSFLWRRIKDEESGKFAPKYITCRVLFAKIIELMEWDTDKRYRMLGKMIRSNGEFLFIFDLKAAETFERYTRGGELKRTRTPIFPAEWKNQFGLSVEEHSKQLQVNIFEDYAVIDVTKKQEKKEDGLEWKENQDPQSPSTL